MVALSQATLSSLPKRIKKPEYDRAALTAGIVHISVGNFHRAHQAAYVDRCLTLPDQSSWGICGMGVVDSPSERAKAEALGRQDGLYSLTLYPPHSGPTCRIIGSIVDYVFAPDDPAGAVAKLADPAVRIVSMTITEGGYNIDEATGRFRLDAPEIARDLANPDAPRSVVGLVTAALERRRAAGTRPFTLLSCDNLVQNGEVLRKAVLAFAEARDPALAAWIDAKVTFPNSMVDRITPAIQPADRARLNELNQIEDEIPVYAEEFGQWLIEDRFCAGRPALQQGGARFTTDVKPLEQLKLRILNASHSMLAYPGLLGGYEFVHQVMNDVRILWLLRSFLDRDVIPQLEPSPAMPPEAYRDIVLERFYNPNIADQLSRIAADGASKIPVFIGETLRGRIDAGGDLRRLAFLLAAFTQYLAGAGDKGARITPHEPRLSAADLALAGSADLVAPLRLGPLQSLRLDRSEAFVDTYVRYRKAIAADGTLPTLGALAREGG